MEIDNEVDGPLAQAMGCMGTVDHDTLVTHFMQVIGTPETLTDQQAKFFLDMNNWNLQAAIGSFYDYSGSGGAQSLPTMEFVSDVTIGEGESVPIDTRFVKTWKIRNPGPNDWPSPCYLKHIEGLLLAECDRVVVDPLTAGGECDVSVSMKSPNSTGLYQSRWQLISQHGIPFGEAIWCIITVEEAGCLGITQQLASTSWGMDTTTNSTAAATTANTTSPQQQQHSSHSQLSSPVRNPFNLSLSQQSSQSTSSSMPNIIAATAAAAAAHSNNNPNLQPTTTTNIITDNNQQFLTIQSSDGTNSIMISEVDEGVRILPNVDRPSSPNGSCGLYAALAASQPDWRQQNNLQHHEASSDNNLPPSPTIEDS